MSTESIIKSKIEEYKFRSKKFIDYANENTFADKVNFDVKEREFSTLSSIIENLIATAEGFFEYAEPYLKQKKKARDFLKSLTKPVDNFLEEIDSYQKNTPFDAFGEDLKDREIEFQTNIFKVYTRFQNKIKKLKGDEELTVFDINIKKTNGKRTPIPLTMDLVMEEKFPQIKDHKKEMKFGTSSDFSSSTQMFINIKDKPKWDITKSYFEQSKDTYQFYQEELKKIREGVTINGYFISPWLYFHLNHFKTYIPLENDPKKKVLTNPPLRDNEILLDEYLQRADRENKGILGFGSRRIAKTVDMTSFVIRNIIATENLGEHYVFGGSKSDLKKLATEIESSYAKITPAFRIPTIVGDFQEKVEFGLTTTNNQDIFHGILDVRNVKGGTEKGSEEGAGGSPTTWILDEVGKFDPRSLWSTSKASFKVAGQWRCIPLMMGTGGVDTLSIGAKELLQNPETNDIIPMDWDYLAKLINIPEYPTITPNKKFGLFFPAQMSIDHVKINKKLSEFLDKKGKELEEIEIKVTNWEESLERINKERESKKNDLDQLNKLKMFYPITTEECFLQSAKNPFPHRLAKKHRQKLIDEGKVGVPIDIILKDGRYVEQLSEKEPVRQFPFNGIQHDAPFLIFDDFPAEKPRMFEIIGGLDSYHTSFSDNSTSLGSLYGWNRVHFEGGEVVPKIVMSVTTRPDSLSDFYEKSLLGIEAYNMYTLIERDSGFTEFMKQKGKTHFLERGLALSKAINPNTSVSNSIGLANTKANKEHVINRMIIYSKQSFLVGKDEEGNDVSKYGIELIDDIYLLDEIINFSWESGNYDRIIAAGHGLALCEHLDIEGVHPQIKTEKTEKTKKRIKFRPSFMKR